ncbi:hypothetical protein GT360_13565 [Vibrio astriarenae]|uniref:Uncharacterized protein n=1 Tax=Vibrio astriarenae TaxID=1481923 RepID=A0A7Z2T563_9VIBR|nr:glycosyltransferase family 2 protein [Vibrio astriarenae]QIA64455.1 hypothetical protein GT360_13565 [Vibrio astriarenae]
MTDTLFFILENPDCRSLELCKYSINYESTKFDSKEYEKARGVKFKNRKEAYNDWLCNGRPLGTAYNRSSNSLLRIILKAKDEPELIEAWLQHHGNLVGYDNIIIMDTGSTSKEYLDILERYKNDVIIFDYKKHYNALHNPKVNRELFELLSISSKYLMVLDADEFLFCFDEGELTSVLPSQMLAESEEEIFCGTWLNNLFPAEFDLDGKLDLSKSYCFDISGDRIKSGTIAGKSIVKSSTSKSLSHIGHNLHSQQNYKLITSNSFGKFFILHFDNLGKELTQKRIKKHLATQGFNTELLSLFESGKELLDYVKKNNFEVPSPRVVKYINSYYYRHELKGESDSIRIDLYNGVDDEDVYSLQSLVYNTNWMSFLND